MTKIRIAITSVLLSLAVAFPLAAECGIDPVTGEGFCGKGDVMTGLGYKANRQVEPILFRYTDSATYIQSCVNVNSHVNVTHDFTRVRNVKADLTTIVRKNGKKLTNITGYLLSGYDDIIPPPFIPGTDLCPSFGEAWVADPNGQYPEATLVSGTGGQLTASDGSRYVPLWPVVLSWGYCSDLTGPASQVCQLP